jgi:hypothetical protein
MDLKSYLGEPGKAAVMEGGKLSTRTMPEVTDEYLLPFFDTGDDD